MTDVMDDRTTRYTNLDYSSEELQQVMRSHYDKLIAFVSTPQFKALFAELMSLPDRQRPAFVQDVLLDDAELKKRDVVVPEGILIQRSAFGDRRPTLFAVKHFLPSKYSDVWQNVNLTFDNKYSDESVSREKDVCWQAPLTPQSQAILLATSDLELAGR